jgi:hypothetical protein
MSKVKLWNDNVHPHTEDFKGIKITIPAGSYVEMDWEEAVELKGQFTPMAPADAPESEKAKYYKMLRIDGSASVSADPLTCHADGTKAENESELKAKLLQFADRIVKDDELDKKSAVQGSEIEALKAQVAALSAAISKMGEKKPVGRPPKAKAANE